MKSSIILSFFIFSLSLISLISFDGINSNCNKQFNSKNIEIKLKSKNLNDSNYIKLISDFLIGEKTYIVKHLADSSMYNQNKSEMHESELPLPYSSIYEINLDSLKYCTAFNFFKNQNLPIRNAPDALSIKFRFYKNVSEKILQYKDSNYFENIEIISQ